MERIADGEEGIRWDMGHRTGVLRRAVKRLAASAKEHEAPKLRKDCVQMGAMPVSELPDREPVRVAGTLRTVPCGPGRARSRALVRPSFSDDGARSMSLGYWARPPPSQGIEPGRALVGLRPR